MTAWAHLPNAVHIDRVIASVKAHRNQWAEAWSKVQDAGRTAEWWEVRVAACNMVKKQGRNAIWDAGRTAEYNAAWLVAWETALETALAVAWYAVLALVAYDDCAYMLDSDPGELAILAAFGNTKAVLLLPACKVFHSSKTIA